MDYPRISLVTGCYNHEKYIGETIESVVSQGYPNLQYVVVNDGSTDKSEKIIKKYARYLDHWETWPGYRKNIVPAINRGFSHTNGEIMGWLNSKNILFPKSLFTLAEIFRELPKINWLTGLAANIDHQGRILSVNSYKKNVYDYLSGDWSVIQQESTFWRRPLWERAGGRLVNRWAFDLELWTRFFLRAKLYHVNTVLGAYRLIPEASSIKNKGRYRRLAEKGLREMRERSSKKLVARARVYRFGRKYFYPILGLMPGKMFGHFFPRCAYKTISYSFQHKSWQIAARNPFKK